MAKSPFKYCRLDAKSFLTDPLLNTPARRGDFASLLALAKVINCNGHYLDEFDEPLSPFEIKKRGRISQSGLTFFIKNGKLVKKDGSYYLKNWAKYQDNYDRRGDDFKLKPRNDSEQETDSRVARPSSEPDKQPDVRALKNDSEIPSNGSPDGEAKSGSIPDRVQKVLDQIAKFRQMLQNPKYGSDQCELFKAEIARLEKSIQRDNELEW